MYFVINGQSELRLLEESNATERFEVVNAKMTLDNGTSLDSCLML